MEYYLTNMLGNKGRKNLFVNFPKTNFEQIIE